jgi:glycosyltransferase involved in cell wall biosynthesis
VSDENGRIELSAIVLGYRAGESLLRVTNPLHRLLADARISFELVVVANYWPGRDDPTVAVARQFAAENDNVRIVSEEKRGGMGWDMRSGLAAARGAYLVVIDGDAQNPVEDVLRMYRELKATGVEVMKGRRTLRHDGPYRRLISVVYNVAFRLLFRTRGLWDINGKPKAMTRVAYERLDLRSDDWFIDAEIVLKARELGLRVAELPVEFFRNDERASFVRPSAIWEFAANMLRTRLGPRR